MIARHRRCCRHCSAPFPPAAGRRYCSRRCKERARETRIAARQHQALRCAWCQHGLPRYRSIYCGDGCQHAAHAHQQRVSHEAAGRPYGLDITAGYLGEHVTKTMDAAYRSAMRTDPCSYCDDRAAALDHITARHHTGADDSANRTGACHQCNSRKQTMPLLQYLLAEAIMRRLAHDVEQLNLLGKGRAQRAGGARLQRIPTR